MNEVVCQVSHPWYALRYNGVINQSDTGYAEAQLENTIEYFLNIQVNGVSVSIHSAGELSNRTSLDKRNEILLTRRIKATTSFVVPVV